MNTLSEDLEEVEGDERARRFVRRLRRRHGIGSDEATCWFVEVQQDYYEPGTLRVINSDSDTKWLGSSPADCLTFARWYAEARYAERDGVGRWTLERYRDGSGAAPTRLVVFPRWDENPPDREED